MEFVNQDISINNAANVNNMPSERQSYLEKICENYSERPLSVKVIAKYMVLVTYIGISCIRKIELLKVQLM